MGGGFYRLHIRVLDLTYVYFLLAWKLLQCFLLAWKLWQCFLLACKEKPYIDELQLYIDYTSRKSTFLAVYPYAILYILLFIKI
jgi:hypothetical protein